MSITAVKDQRRSVEESLTQAITSLEAEQSLKKTIREAVDPLDDVARSALSELNLLHSIPSSEHATLCEKCLATVVTSKSHWTTVASLIPKGEFYRYQFAIGPTLRSFVTAVAMAHFLLKDELIPAFAISSLLGLGEGEIILSAEDYLQGVIGMVNELPRLSINAVTTQNFFLPIKISAFVNDIFASYSLLNLRNDALRRRFDSLKYDVKRCEDVVYDLTLRGLTPAPTSA
ncbi:hypothetical protein TREMEDRAFT_63473 [Tremella mesenterica DSM 1558]|uniref:uncharacterized protein n=1 Tax=Tremella mesenterica (strain ATCC 24925 / CBS 8224 / DSM 1558 / NBRC 9311 / NRRL Y-6157 / RJB 2259-6 / UBC 559-6) TaxID=578456 RepID=UPI0003F4978D|nr:uncharacterized protein TREMEDRAFT_63473 [Tremella mesenterica DSM 1558]EIW68301.1 hypothetical protein TREMEDRAFT_63473 [Tremella mesenterica DSM 1558]